MAEQSYFFKLSMDGELLAEAPLIIHDEAQAWKAFQAVFATMAPQIVSEFFETMRIACDPELRKATGNKPGFSVDLATKPRPNLIIPTVQASPGKLSMEAVRN